MAELIWAPMRNSAEQIRQELESRLAQPDAAVAFS